MKIKIIIENFPYVSFKPTGLIDCYQLALINCRVCSFHGTIECLVMRKDEN
jgi:hypothetical protein